MMSHTTLHTLLAVALLSLPLSMPLHADEDGLSAALSIELGTPNNVSDDVDAFMQQKQNGVSFKSDFADDENTDSKDEDGTGTNEGVPNENAPSPSDEKLNNNDPEQINPPKLDEKKDENAPKGLFDLQDVAYFLRHCPVLQKLFESVWFQVQTVGALALVPFMTYKTLSHLKGMFTDKENRSKHAIRSLLYATSGVIILKAFIQYMHELNAQAVHVKA